MLTKYIVQDSTDLKKQVYFRNDDNRKIRAVTEKNLLAEKEKKAVSISMKHKPVCEELKMISGLKKQSEEISFSRKRRTISMNKFSIKRLDKKPLV